jgi:hypothetical protein
VSAPHSQPLAEVVVGSSIYRVVPYHDAFELTRNTETLVIVGSKQEAVRRLKALTELLRPPTQCPVCCRHVLDNGTHGLANHNQAPTALGRKGRRCPGSGLKPKGAL